MFPYICLLLIGLPLAGKMLFILFFLNLDCAFFYIGIVVLFLLYRFVYLFTLFYLLLILFDAVKHIGQLLLL